MHTNDLLVLLNNLSSKETKGFHAYLKKEFKEGSLPLRLFQFLRRYSPEFLPNKVSYTKAHTFLAPGKPFNKTMVLNNLSDIRIALRKYLVEQHLQKTPFLQDMILLQVYGERQLDKHFEKQLKDLNTSLEKTNQKDLWFWLKKMQLEDEKYSFMTTKRLKARSSIHNAMENLDHFYAAAKLRYSSEIFNGYQILDEPKPEIQFLSEIEQTDWDEEFTYHRTYKNVLQLIRTRSTKLYYNLKQFFLAKHSQMTKKDQFIILAYLLNHTSYEVRKGNEKFITESLSLLKFGFENEVFIFQGILAPEHLLNAIEVAGHLNQAQWAKALIKKWKTKLEPSTREYYTILSKAILYFRIQEFESCSKTLAQIEVKEPQDKLRGRWLGIIADYEWSANIDSTLNRCGAFEKFVQRNTLIHKKRKKAVFLSIKIMRMLLKIGPKKEKILGLLEKSDDFHYKNWMVQKANKL